jgi:hypothetical protein
MRTRLGERARIVLMAAVLGMLMWAPAGSGGSGSVSSRATTCPGGSDLRTRSIRCATARRVLGAFFGQRPKVDPGPSPAGWACHQHQGDHTSEGGDDFEDLCHSLRHPGRRLHLAWTTDLR